MLNYYKYTNTKRQRSLIKPWVDIDHLGQHIHVLCYKFFLSTYSGEKPCFGHPRNQALLLQKLLLLQKKYPQVTLKHQNPHPLELQNLLKRQRKLNLKLKARKPLILKKQTNHKITGDYYEKTSS